MNHKHLLIAAILSVLPAKAMAEKVYFCQMKEFVSVGADGVQNWKLERFTMKVTESSVVFASDGYFEGASLSSTDYSYEFFSDSLLYIGSWSTSVYFKEDIFLFSSIDPLKKRITNLTASCDTF